jgi:hypothetical protein
VSQRWPRILAPIAATVFCVAPAATLNIWPRLHDMISGQVDATAVGLVTLQTVSVVVMSAAPFAHRRPGANKRAVKAVALMLLLTNWYLAKDSIGSIYDAHSDPRQAAIEHKQHLEDDLAEARKDRANLPAFTFTTQDRADEAKKIADKECLKPGSKCEAANKVLQDRSQTVEADRLNNKIDSLSQQLRNLPPVPSDAHKVPSFVPYALALVAELLALSGAYVLGL